MNDLFEVVETESLCYDDACRIATEWTDAFKEYNTAMPDGKGEWFVTNRFDPRVVSNG